MPSIALRTRINQITILVGVAFLFYQITNWEQGIWILISTFVLVGPISTFLGYEKAKDRFLGTSVGVLIAFCIEYYLYWMPSQLPVIAFIIAVTAGFMVTRPYKYFIIIITTMTCLGYTYMNMPYTPFAPVSFVVYRLLGVFVGVLLFLAIQNFWFGTGNAKLELLETSYGTLSKLRATLQQYLVDQTVMTAYNCATDIFSNSKDLNNYVRTADFVLSGDGQAELRHARQVILLNNRALKLLVDTPTVSSKQIEKLLHIVDLKLERR
jgi:uncharacterized membrane protein YccC